MPKTADYSKGFIYKFVCNDITIPNIYVGSSTDWVKRKSNHKYSCNNENDKAHNYFVYQFMRENGGWINFTMLKIIDFPCQNKFELELEERRYMELLKSDLNKIKPGRTIHEHYMDNRTDIIKKVNEWVSENKEKRKEYQNKYHYENKEKAKQRREHNKEKNQAIECCPTCGHNYTHINKTQHLKSKKHNDAMQPI